MKQEESKIHMDYLKPNMEIVCLDVEENMILTSGEGLGTGDVPDEGTMDDL